MSTMCRVPVDSLHPTLRFDSVLLGVRASSKHKAHVKGVASPSMTGSSRHLGGLRTTFTASACNSGQANVQLGADLIQISCSCSVSHQSVKGAREEGSSTQHARLQKASRRPQEQLNILPTCELGQARV